MVIALAAGGLIGLSLGALGGGGSILAVPVLVYLLDQSASQATTGSLVVVGAAALLGAITAYRAGSVLLAQGLAFGVVSIGGAVAGARASVLVSGQVLMVCFAALMLVVGGLMTLRRVSHARGDARFAPSGPPDPIFVFRPAFLCDCPRAAKVLVAATVVGLLTGFLGVGGGFLVVPALIVALDLPMQYAVGTSLVVIALASAAGLAVRTGVGEHPDWVLVAILTVASAVAGVVGARWATRFDTTKLAGAFTVLVLTVAAYTAVRAVADVS
jgi:uncharacterized membrane protein YfcA